MPSIRTVGLGLITGAADDDPSAIGTYAAAGAKFGPALLWTAPITLPMMFVVVYLSAKLGQVSGQGLFAAMRQRYPSWLVYLTLSGVIAGNTFEAAADLGGMAAAIGIFVPLRFEWIVVGLGITMLALQIFGSFDQIKKLFRWLALSLLAYVIAAFYARPDWGAVVRGTLVPTIRFDVEYLSMLVAIIGTSLSAYLYTWQSNEEVEEEIAMGRRRLEQRKGATEEELRDSRRDILTGMIFSNIVMYFIILSTSATLHVAGRHDVTSAAEAARALEPIAGRGAGLLFALGVIGVGFLAVPVMTAGAAYDIAQTLGWRNSLHAPPRAASRFYAIIAVVTAVAIAINWLGFNPMKLLVVSGIVQGFSTPPLMLLILLMTSSHSVMGERANGRGIKALAAVTLVAISAASAGLLMMSAFT